MRLVSADAPSGIFAAVLARFPFPESWWRVLTENGKLAGELAKAR